MQRKRETRSRRSGCVIFGGSREPFWKNFFSENLHKRGTQEEGDLKRISEETIRKVITKKGENAPGKEGSLKLGGGQVRGRESVQRKTL